jgi:peptidoglycan/xylan/chitin deacetylase (PgdA/CDA1 family)
LNRYITSAIRRVSNAWPTKPVFSRLSAPVASFTFDDFPHTAWTNGAPILESFGVRGTYFVAHVFSPESLNKFPDTEVMTGVSYYELDDIVAAHTKGHEIGCHTFDHKRVSQQNNCELLDSIDRNAEFVKHLLGDVIMTSFAYPQGNVSIGAKRFLSRKFSVCRGTQAGINAKLLELSQLKCFNLDANFDKNSIDALIKETKLRNGWIIFNTHDVINFPSPYGCTPELLYAVVAAVAASGIEILPIKHALGRAMFRPIAS